MPGGMLSIKQLNFYSWSVRLEVFILTNLFFESSKSWHGLNRKENAREILLQSSTLVCVPKMTVVTWPRRQSNSFYSLFFRRWSTKRLESGKILFGRIFFFTWGFTRKDCFDFSSQFRKSRKRGGWGVSGFSMDWSTRSKSLVFFSSQWSSIPNQRLSKK